MGMRGGVALGLVHTRIESGSRCRACLVQRGRWVDLRPPSCRVRGAEPPSSSLSLKGASPGTGVQNVQSGHGTGTQTGKLKAGSGLVEAGSGPSPTMDWLDIFFFFFLNKFIYLFLAALGLRCCSWAFSSCGERGLLFVLVRGLLMWQSTGSRRVGFSSCGTRAQ